MNLKNLCENRYKPQPPKYEVGHTKGDLTVLSYLGRHPCKPGDPKQKLLAQTMHYYEVRCACGTVEVISQVDLSPRSTRVSCVACGRKRGQAKRNSKPKVGVVTAAPDVPRFERMKW